MTITLAIKYDSGVVIGADSQLTNAREGYKEKCDKVVKKKNIAYALSGDLEFLDEVKMNIEEKELESWKKKDVRGDIKSSVSDKASELYSKMENIGKGALFEGGEVIMAGISDGESYAYKFNNLGAATEVRGFEVSGSSGGYARFILENRYDNPDKLDRTEAIGLAYITIKRCCGIDPQVGEPIDLYVVDEEEGHIKETHTGEEKYIDKAMEAEEEIMNVLKQIPYPALLSIAEKLTKHDPKEIKQKLEELETEEKDKPQIEAKSAT